MMLKENLQKIMGQVEKYFAKSGISHHFKDGGIFSHMNLKDDIKKIIQKNEKHQSNFKDDLIIEGVNVNACLCNLCGNNIAEKAILDLFKLINFTGVSQDQIIKNVIQYQTLMNTPQEKIINKDGKCAGIVLAYIAGELDKISKKPELTTLNPQLHEFEKSLSNIAHWDGKVPVEQNLQKDIEFFIQTVCDLQDQQNNPYSSFINITGTNHISSNLSLSWIFNQDTLAYILEKSSNEKPQLIYLGADNHASMIYPQSNNSIIYFNPNQQFGSMKLNVDNSFFDLFCGGISTGHTNTYTDRMPVSLEVFSSSKKPIDLKIMIDDLIHVMIKNDPNLQKLDKNEAVRKIINSQASNHRTALMEAARVGNLAEVKLLLNEYKAIPDLNDVYGKNALYYAIISGDESCAIEILNHIEKFQANKEIDGMSYLHRALAYNMPELAKKLLLNEDIKLNSKAKKEPFKGFTPLYFAIKAGYEDICENLITNQDVLLNTAENLNGMTPLHFAIYFNQPQIVKLLLQQKRLDVNQCSEKKEEHHPNGCNAFSYLAKEFSYLDDESEEYADTLIKLVDIYEQLIQAGVKQDGLTSQDQLNIYYYLLQYDDKYAKDLQQHIHQGIIVLDKDDPKCTALVDYLITKQNAVIDEQDVKTLEFYLNHSEEINLESISVHFNLKPQIISHLSEKSQQNVMNLALLDKNNELIKLLIKENPDLLNQVFVEEENKEAKTTLLRYFIHNKMDDLIIHVITKHKDCQDLTKGLTRTIKLLENNHFNDIASTLTPSSNVKKEHKEEIIQAKHLPDLGLFKENKPQSKSPYTVPLTAFVLITMGAVTVYTKFPSLFNALFGVANVENNTQYKNTM